MLLLVLRPTAFLLLRTPTHAPTPLPRAPPVLPLSPTHAPTVLPRVTGLACCSTFKPPALVEPPHPATLPSDVLQRDCTVSHTKGSGPGGQHRNKVQTAVVLKHKPTGLVGSASDSRSQNQNRAAALFRLRLRFALEQRVAALPEPSALWRSRCRSGKLRVNEAHEDFPALLSEALDVVWETQDVKQAAERLTVSSSQLIRFFKQEPKAMAFVNSLRASQGLGPLN